MKRTTKTVLTVVLLASLVGLTVYAGNTYALLTSTTAREVSVGNSAEWTFKTRAEEAVITPTLDKSGIGQYAIADEKIAPGSKGKIEIALKNSGNDVAVHFKVQPQKNDTLPTGLKFYANADYTDEITSEKAIGGDFIRNSSATQIVTIYWKWDFSSENGANDANDMTFATTSQELKVPVKIIGTQIDQTSNVTTAITGLESL